MQTSTALISQEPSTVAAPIQGKCPRCKTRLSTQIEHRPPFFRVQASSCITCGYLHELPLKPVGVRHPSGRPAKAAVSATPKQEKVAPQKAGGEGRKGGKRGRKPKLSIVPSRPTAPEAKDEEPAPSAPSNPSASLVLSFDLSSERDRRLFEKIRELAELDRRSPDAEILVLLEEVVGI